MDNNKSRVNITIFTATYNREYSLTRLYKSMLNQKYENFEWLIIDDGSKDNTEGLVAQFIEEKKIDIRYYKQENSGKHIAINQGVKLAKGELFFIVDSDDYILKNSLLKIWSVWKSIDKKDEFIGVGGKKILNGLDLNFKIADEYLDCNTVEFNFKYKNIQDKAEVFHTEKLKKYEFKKFEEEKFMTEAVIWYKMAEDGYLIRWFNESIYAAEYLEDGLSRNFYSQRIQSINGTCYAYNLLSTYHLPKKYKMRYKINYFRYGLVSKTRKELVDQLLNRKNWRIAYAMGLIYMKIVDYRYRG